MALDFPDNPINGTTYPYTYTITDDSTGLVVADRDVVYTYSSASDAWTGQIVQASTIATPEPSEVTATPPFSNALDLDAGTQANPYKMDPVNFSTPSGAFISNQVINITNQSAGEKIFIQYMEGGSRTRFEQPIKFCDAFGNTSTGLKYSDDPTTVTDTSYSAVLRTGNTWISWQVNQIVADPITPQSSTTISVSGNNWTVGQIATMIPGTIEGGFAPYSYKYYWQGSQDLSNWFDITVPSSDQSATSLTISNQLQGFYIRGVTDATDSTTPTNQNLTLVSASSNTTVAGAPVVSDVVLRKSSSGGQRFTQQTYSNVIVLSNDGTGSSTRSIKVTFALPNGFPKYGVVDAAGIITSLSDSEQNFTVTTQQGNIVLTFPSVFSDGVPPDTALPIGTSIVTTAKVENLYGSSEKNSNIINPELGRIVAYPTPDSVKGFTQFDDPLVADQSPFNTAAPLGSSKNTYSFSWNYTPINILFDPVWDVSSTPITQFQGGGLQGGFNDFTITFRDENNIYTTATINTTNSDWSAPYTFGNFIPPTKIRGIILTTNQIESKLTGLIGFYDANDNSVLYETINATQNNLNLQKQESIAYLTDGAHIPQLVYEDGYFHVLHYNRVSSMDVSFEVAFTDGSTVTLSDTTVLTNVSYDIFLSNLVAGLSIDSKVTPSVTDRAIKLTATDVAIHSVRVTISSSTTNKSSLISFI